MHATRERTAARPAPETPARRGRDAGASRPGPAMVLQRELGNRIFRQTARGGAPRVQRACACGGTCAHCKQEEGTVQTKLTVGAPGDAYEQEAERVAARVTGAAEGAPPAIRRLSAGAPAAGHSDVSLPAGEGRPLSPATRDFMEPRIGADFSGVRLHAGPQAEAASDRLQARAFTYGSDVWLGRGASEGDRRLMAHELTHVVQQGSAGPRVQRDPPPPPPAAPQQCPGGVKTVTVDLVSLPGSTRNPPADLDNANRIYAPCCVRFQIGTGLSVAPALASTWLGGDNDVVVSPSCGTVGGEEQAMYDGAAARFDLGGRMRAFYVESFSGHVALGYSIPPFCATGAAGPYVNSLVIRNGSFNDTLAHELGHILLDSGDHQGIDNPADTTNLMFAPGRTGSNLDPTQCGIIFGNA